MGIGRGYLGVGGEQGHGVAVVMEIGAGVMRSIVGTA